MLHSLYAYSLLKHKTSKIVILKDNSEIDEMYFALDFFRHFFDAEFALERFYSYEIPPVSSIPPSSFITSNRIKTIYSLLNKQDKDGLILLTSINALFQPVMSEELFFDSFESFKKGDVVDIKWLTERLLKLNYTKKDFVEEPGDFAKRGSVFDVFSPLYDKPLRFEFFSDEIESIKKFYVANQRTSEYVNFCDIPPAREYDYKDDEFGYIKLANSSHTAFLIDYAQINSFGVYKDFDEGFLKDVVSSVQFYKKSYGESLFISQNRLDSFLKKAHDMTSCDDCSFLFVENASLDEKISAISKESKKNKVVIACASKTRAERVEKFLKDKGLYASFDIKSSKNGIYLSDYFLKRGFFDKKSRTAFVSFEDLFGKIIQNRSKKKTVRFKSFIQDSKVVHKDYGIGLYKGIKKIKIDSEFQDFIEIEYARNDTLYVPVYGADSVFEYHGDAKIDQLGSSRWKTSQENIKRSIKKILTELINTYAKRQLSQRKPFVVDMCEYREFEAMFEYEETKDQAKAVNDIKEDMQKLKPMDRLICGDVSFGKTEVAMRASAIAVFNAKQVVFMSPTTVLSLQHYKTICKRFEQFPVNVALLNRFSTKKERDTIIEGLKKGVIDILVTTHSVYSDKIEFADLGLVVIDEEQRFGVKIKEHLKAKYPDVDMLYLSATPIPRTLNMALNGIFDISIIKTPPLERKPIETFVLKRKSSIIRDAVLKELSRNGSVYFVHNNIENIETIKHELDNLVPFAKKAIVHAKMNKKDIKSTLNDFNNGKFDILIATSIIEAGLDIKNVNTIIIDNADRFGLADLYQLRGRVGRGDKVAYAYLLRPKEITQDAQKRLYFMKEFVERGVGFNLALKDMEIRGGGNILGKDQAGKVKAIGFETYASLIEEAAREMKNLPIERDVEIKCSFSAYIDDNFASEEDKFTIYKTIYAAKSLEELDDVKEEIEDTFGKLKEEIQNLFFIAYLRILSKNAFVKKLSVSQKGVLMEFYVDANIDTDKLVYVVNNYKAKFVSEFSVFFENLGKEFEEIYLNLKNILQSIV